MQRLGAVALGCFLAVASAARLTRLSSEESPVVKVVELIRRLRAGVKEDGMKEQQLYDKSACWCEKTLERKAAAISDAKESITKLQNRILELKADLASHGAEIKQLTKDIAANRKAQREAEEVREKENGEYEDEKVESEQCIGAISAAIKVLSGAGEGERKAGFLATLQQAQLVSAAEDVGRALRRSSAASRAVSEQDLETVRRFAENPASFAHTGGFSGAQVENNPFGDYAPQSTQIQGILKGMYDATTAALEKDNAEEGEKQKGFQELMATKKTELATLQESLATQERDHARKTKELASSTTELDDTKEQLEADETFFATTKDACKQRAVEWARVTQLRTGELQGIDQALEILNSPEAQETFSKSSTTLLQVRSVAHRRTRAYSALSSSAAIAKSAHLAQIAAEVRSGGHFDKVLAMIDEMIVDVRKEEADDIAHRDRCEGDTRKNENDIEDLKHSKKKAGEESVRTQDKADKAQAEVDKLEVDIAGTKDDLKEALELRNDAVNEFRKALKEDADAVMLLQEAISALTKFYKKNKIDLPTSFMQQPDEEYTVDEDKMPEGVDADYQGRKSGETTNIVSMLSMIVEDIQKEIEESKADNAAAQESYEKERAAIRETLFAQEKSKAAAETANADLKEKVADHQEFITKTQSELDAQKKLRATLKTDCQWLDTHFDSRRKKRKAELRGLADAKSALAGADQGDYDEVAMMS